jgi:predicted RNase H-like nuclease (RuvC/YqgF family)
MKKFGTLIVGIIIGVGLTLSPQIYGASVKLLGKDVDNQLEVKLNDKVIGQAAVIEGTSYIPVRAFANEYQLDVAVDSKTITLTSPSSEENAKLAQEQEDAANLPIKIENLKNQITFSKEKIASLESGIADAELEVKKFKEQLDTANSNAALGQVYKDRAKNNYDAAVQGLESGKSELAKEQTNLADLEAQLAALQQK